MSYAMCAVGAQMLARPEDLVEMLEGADPDLEHHERTFFHSGSLTRWAACIQCSALAPLSCISWLKFNAGIFVLRCNGAGS